MLQTVKKQLFELVQGLGYNITDNGTYKEDFPWLMLRTNRFVSTDSNDVRYQFYSFIIDIFSTYNGEKEILDIVENINNNLQQLREINPYITQVSQADLKIIGDKATGPVRKHGIATYQFILTFGLEDQDEETSSTGN